MLRNYLAFVLACVSLPGLSQIPSISDTTTTPVPNAGHDYIQTGIETVDPATGSVSIRLGVPLPPSRGITVPFHFAYDSSGVFYVGCPSSAVCKLAWYSANARLAQGGWSYSAPMMTVQETSTVVQDVTPTDQVKATTCYALTNFVMQDTGGNRHNLGVGYSSSMTACPYEDNYSNVSSAQVGPLSIQTNATWTGTLGRINPLTVTDADGTVYSFEGQAGPGVCSTCSATIFASTITDRNGNSFQLTNIPGQPSVGGHALTYTDTVGRQALDIPTFGANPDTVTVSGLSQPYHVNWTTVQAHFSVPFNNVTGSGTCGSPSSQPVIQAISSITLPNGKQYSFSYDPTYGLVNKITYPAGGYVRYVWGLNAQSALGSQPTYQAIPILDGNGIPVGTTEQVDGECQFHYDVPAVIQRFVSYDGVHEVLEQDFSYCTVWPTSTSCAAPASGSPGYFGYWSSKQTTVVTKDKIRGTQYSTVYSYGATTTDAQPNVDITPIVPVENTVAYYDTNGTLLQTVAKHWGNERILKQQTTTLGNQVSQTNWTYNPTEMVTEKDDYDFGPGTPSATALRKTIFPSVYHTNSPAFSSQIIDEPDWVKVEDGSGNVLAGVSYGYDTHGNILSRSDWLNSSGSSAVTTSHTYDSYGNIHTTIDPNQNLTTYNYLSASGNDPFVDSCTYTSPASVYLASIVYPSTNGVSHTESFQYHCATGSLANSTDQNRKVTSYIYNTPASGCSSPDGLNRLSEIDYPDGGKTTNCYNDSMVSATTPSVSTSKLLSATVSETNVSIGDGMGHVVHTQLTSDPQGVDQVDTVYDGSGHVYTTSNSYRSTSDPTYGVTTTTYDALGRQIVLSHPDGTTYQWCYNGIVSSPSVANCSAKLGGVATGTWVDVTDEVGNHWQRTTNALGNLTKVVEPGNLVTNYSYDALGNLQTVNQTGITGSTPRNRNFQYDLLSRLIAANNPEAASSTVPASLSCAGATGTTWTACYGYDSNGNLTSKIDNRSITTNYSYDALNRLSTKSYSTNSNGTPWSCYLYDSASVTNGTGRLSNEWTQSASHGSCSSTAPSSGFYAMRSMLAYDSMGRLLNEQQSTLASAASGKVYAPAYTYDLAGDLVTSTDGTTPSPTAGTMLTFTNAYDGAGHLVSLTSNWADTVQPVIHPATLFSAPSNTSSPPCANSIAAPYTAFGALANATYGSGLTLNRSYDARLRQTCETDIGTGNTPATSGTATVTITGAEQNH